jgi:hypothetical protein
MKSFSEFITESNSSGCTRFYTGEPLETGGTSIAGDVAPPIRDLFKKGVIKQGDTILDYGAGKYGRNANWLREQGCNVFAFDPYNGKTSDGWEGVSSQKPKNVPHSLKFDIVFSAYVLNVVPEHVESGILQDIKRYKGDAKEFHITRNKDIFDSVKNALARGEKTVTNFFKRHFMEQDEATASVTIDDLSDDLIREFCCFGVQTSRGFQRIPFLESKGFKLMRSTGGFKVYTR